MAAGCNDNQLAGVAIGVDADGNPIIVAPTHVPGVGPVAQIACGTAPTPTAADPLADDCECATFRLAPFDSGDWWEVIQHEGRCKWRPKLPVRNQIYSTTAFPSVAWNKDTTTGATELLASLNFHLPQAQHVVVEGILKTFPEAFQEKPAGGVYFSQSLTLLSFDEPITASTTGGWGDGGTMNPDFDSRRPNRTPQSYSISSHPVWLEAGNHTANLGIRLITQNMALDDTWTFPMLRLTVRVPRIG